MSKSRKKNILKKDLRSEKYRQRREQHIKVRRREIEKEEAKQEIREFKNGQ